MAVIDRIKQALGLTVKESRSWPAILSLGLNGPQWMPENYHAFAQEGYIANADVYACINASVRAFRGVEFGVFLPKGEGQKQITKGPLADLLKRPNPRQSWSSIAGEWAGCMEMTGNAYIEGISSDKPDADILKQPPKELYILRPDRMFVVPGVDARLPIAGYEYRAGSMVVPYRAQLWRDTDTGGLRPRLPVMHSKYWHPLNDFYGLSPIAAAARNVDAFNAAVAWNVSLLQNAARPGGVFSTEQNMSSEQAQEYTNIIRQKFSGPGNAGRPLVLGMGLNWTSVGTSPTEMDWLKGLEWNTRKICSIFGIPAQIISDEESKTYANYEEANQAVWNQKWLPMLDMFCADLNSWLTPLYRQQYGDEIYIGYNRDAIEAIQEDRQIKWENAVKGAGFLRVNEQRALLGYDPLPEGEVILVPVGTVPLDVAGAQTMMPQERAAEISSEASARQAQQNQQNQQNQAGQPALPGKPGALASPKPKPKPKPKPQGDEEGEKPPKKKPSAKSSDEVIGHEFVNPSEARVRLDRLIASFQQEEETT